MSFLPTGGLNPNWAAIAQIMGGALGAQDGQWGQGAAQGAQNYQQMQGQRQDQQYREQQMQIARQQADMQKAEFDRQVAADAQWQGMFAQPQATQVGPTRPDQPQGYQTATAPQQNPLFANLDPTQRALLQMADRKTGLGMLSDWTEAPSQPSSVQEYEYAQKQGFQGSIFDYQRQKAEAGRAPIQPQGPTERQRNAEAAGLKPGTPEYAQYMLGRDDTQPGPFQGTGLDAQSYNIVLTGDPASPEYAASYANLAMPKVQFDAVTGKSVIVQPDMSWARRPGGHSAPPPPTGDGVATQQFPGGTVTSNPGAPVYNEGQGKAAGFADRMSQANGAFDQFQGAGMDRTEGWRGAVPIFGNSLISSDRQQFEQAERNFINAQLRRESGAVINPEEFAEAREQYIPQPGDDAGVLAQKAESRRIAIEAMQREGGPFYKPGGGKKTVIDGFEIEELP